MITRMNPKQQALAVAKMMAKRGKATEAQLALIAEAEATKKANAAEAAAKRKESARAAREWAEAHKEEIAKVAEENKNWFFDETFKMYYTIQNGKKIWA